MLICLFFKKRCNYRVLEWEAGRVANTQPDYTLVKRQRKEY